MFALLSCTISAPPSKNVGNPKYILKFVPTSHDDQIIGFFSLADSETNQIAAAGNVRLQIYTTTTVSMGSASAPGMKLQNTVYDNSFAVGVSNFHWETFGSFVKVQDLACRFVIPYNAFRQPIMRGKVVTVKMEFLPDGGSNRLEMAKNISVY